MNSVVDNSVNFNTEEDADPLLGVNAIHWLVCQQTYNVNRAETLGRDRDWFIGYQDDEICVYHKLDDEGYVLKYSIIGFRGTKVKKDVWDDIALSKTGSKSFPRAEEGIAFVGKYLDENPELDIQLTGHSLGGAIARVVGQTLGLGIITFNAAAPPLNPVLTGPNEIDYHIVYDIVSAWQHPNTIRIDKGYRPVKIRSINPKIWLDKTLDEAIKSHSLQNFSNQKKGNVINATEENQLFKVWFYSLPLAFKKIITVFLLGWSSRISLPDIK